MAEKRPDRVLGPGHDTFWAHCDDGELWLPRCDSCGRLHWPIVPACEQCHGTAFRWEKLSGRGTILSWCSFEHDYYRGLFPIPHDTILVELAEGPLFVSNPAGFGREDITQGMPVTVTFLDAEDSAGPFRLPVFART